MKAVVNATLLISLALLGRLSLLNEWDSHRSALARLVQAGVGSRISREQRIARHHLRHGHDPGGPRTGGGGDPLH